MPVPYRFTLYRIAPKLGIPPWVLEGYPADEPPVDWIIRVLEYARMEASVTVDG